MSGRCGGYWDVFRSSEVEWLRKRLRGALERGAGVPKFIQLKGGSQAQWDVVNGLLGRPASLARGVLRVPTEELERRVDISGAELHLCRGEEAAGSARGSVGRAAIGSCRR